VLDLVHTTAPCSWTTNMTPMHLSTLLWTWVIVMADWAWLYYLWTEYRQWRQVKMSWTRVVLMGHAENSIVVQCFTPSYQHSPTFTGVILNTCVQRPIWSSEPCNRLLWHQNYNTDKYFYLKNTGTSYSTGNKHNIKTLCHCRGDSGMQIWKQEFCCSMVHWL